ncbi:hypothetical protein Tco_0218347 [Tanacetum coccineum]
MAVIGNTSKNGPTPHPMITDPPPTGSTIVPAPRKKLDSEFNDEEFKLEGWMIIKLKSSDYHDGCSMTTVVDDGTFAAVRFHGQLCHSTSATNNPVKRTDDAIMGLMTITNPVSSQSILLDTEAQNVPTEVSADTSDKVSMIAILTDLQTQLDGHAKVNQEKCLEIETLKNELLQCKQEICRLDTHKVKLDLGNQLLDRKQ